MKQALGVWNILSDRDSTSQLAEFFDFIYVDLEHGFRSIDDLLATVMFYNIKKVDFSVRVRRFDDPMIQTLLDAGVRKFVLPQLRSIEELVIFKRSLLFPPNGTRGLHPKSTLNINTPEDENIAITVVIETPEALTILKEIANETLVSDLYLGAFDLSMELNVFGGPFSAELDQYFTQIKSVCREYGKNFVAMLPENIDPLFASKHALNKVVVGIDSMLIRKFYLQLIKDLRGD